MIVGCRCGSKSQLAKPWFRANDTDDNNAAARRAYESLMTITLRKPDSPEYLNFSRQVIKRAKHYSGTDVYDDDEGVTCTVLLYNICNIKNANLAHERVRALANISCSPLCCHNNEIREPIANPPNSAQLGGTRSFLKLHLGPCSSAEMRRVRDRQTHKRA